MDLLKLIYRRIQPGEPDVIISKEPSAPFRPLGVS